MSDELMPAAIDGSLSLDELLSDHFVRDLHARRSTAASGSGPAGGE